MVWLWLAILFLLVVTRLVVPAHEPELAVRIGTDLVPITLYSLVQVLMMELDDGTSWQPPSST